MRRARLTTLLLASTGGLLLVVVSAVSWKALAALRQSSEAEAVARVEAVAAEALNRLEQESERLLASARLLAERPTLARLLANRDGPQLRAFLERFRQTSGLDSAAVVALAAEDSGAAIAATGEALPSRLDRRAVFVDREAAGLRLVAIVEGLPAARVVVARRIDAGRLVASAEAPLAVRWTSAARAAGEAAGEISALRVAARRLRRASGRIQETREVLAVRAVSDPGGMAPGAPGAPGESPADGDVAGFVEVSLPLAEVAAPLASLRREIASTAAALSLAGLLGLGLWAWRVRSQLDALAGAAERIGAGDLGSPVPAPPQADLGFLAERMDEMRRKLGALTEESKAKGRELEVVLEGMSDGVLAVDRERNVRFANRRAAEILGLDPAAASGRFCGDLLEPAAVRGRRPCEWSCPILDARFQGPSKATELLAAGAGAEGGRAFVVTASSPSADRQVVVLRRETSPEQGRRLRDAVLANLSHEFKTPLAAQLAAIELLRPRLPAADEEAARLLRSQQRGALRLLQLVDNLLESARLEAGIDSIRRRPVDLGKLLEEAAIQVEPLLEQKGQRLRLEIRRPLPEFAGDAARLLQVLVNLLANAHKFSPAHGEIRLGAQAAGGTVRAWVDDEGPGLASADKLSVFERFVRAAPDEQEPEEHGAGLGLAIARSIVDRHGGKLTFERPDGRALGTRALLILPVATEP
jgi:signal transduction histidine kinase